MLRSHKLVSACVSATFLGACGGNGFPSSGVSAATPLAAPGGKFAAHHNRKDVQLETVLYSFTGSPDGAETGAPLLNVGGTLYGTTSIGGTSNNGTVFKITPAGTYSQLYSFAGGSDGGFPQGSLADVGGTLYGTTWQGGANNEGTVFSITPSGTETVLHSFSGNDGANPYGGLAAAGGKLYGSTYFGGANGDGTVFKVTTAGRETVLHSFAGTDGAGATSALIKVAGKFYGTTCSGGTSNAGTVFDITTSGAEAVIHSFSGDDGNCPFNLGGLVKVGSALYGTTGGPGGTFGHGTIFKITTAGSFSNVYSFKGGTDGDGPYAGLTNVNGTLFGTTPKGGGSGCPAYGGCGVIFELLPNSGSEIVVYDFTGGSDGSWPNAALTNINGTLYGATNNNNTNGLGTVFSLSF